jgi:hypothetical protein
MSNIINMSLFIRLKKHYINLFIIHALKKEILRRCNIKLLSYVVPTYLVYPSTIVFNSIYANYF